MNSFFTNWLVTQPETVLRSLKDVLSVAVVMVGVATAFGFRDDNYKPVAGKRWYRF